MSIKLSNLFSQHDDVLVRLSREALVAEIVAMRKTFEAKVVEAANKEVKLAQAAAADAETEMKVMAHEFNKLIAMTAKEQIKIVDDLIMQRQSGIFKKPFAKLLELAQFDLKYHYCKLKDALVNYGY